MIELIVDKKEDLKTIAAIENGRLVEIYEENEQKNKKQEMKGIYI